MFFSRTMAFRTGLCAVGLAAAATSTVAAEAFVTLSLADGVTLYRPAQPGDDKTNSLVVERDDGLLVVDAQPNPESAKQLLAQIARSGSKPVRYLVLSHPHAEAAGGASAFPSSVLVVGTEGCLSALRDPAYDFGAEQRSLVSDREAWSEPRRRLPTLVVQSRTVLFDGRNSVELLPLGRRVHSVGDMVVRLPDSDVAYFGALLFPERRPYAKDAHVGAWLSVLNGTIGETPGKMVSLRGGPQTKADLRVQRDALAWLRGQVEQGFAELLPLEKIQQKVLQDDGFDQRFDTSFAPQFASILVHQVIEESADHRRKRGRLLVDDWTAADE